MRDYSRVMLIIRHPNKLRTGAELKINCCGHIVRPDVAGYTAGAGAVLIIASASACRLSAAQQPFSFQSNEIPVSLPSWLLYPITEPLPSSGVDVDPGAEQSRAGLFYFILRRQALSHF